jgi:hypothetical protein
MKNKVKVIGWIDLSDPKFKGSPTPKKAKESSNCTMCGRVKYTSECGCEDLRKW